ncbi:beta-ketoacyl synthase N-terminal-like domain-containing protein [Streptomyces sp. NPDC055287]
MSTRKDDIRGASRPFAADRDGFVMAEGPGALVLGRAQDARARRRPQALLAGRATTCDAHHPTVLPEGAPGAERALRAAPADADLCPADVDHVNAHAGRPRPTTRPRPPSSPASCPAALASQPPKAPSATPWAPPALRLL